MSDFCRKVGTIPFDWMKAENELLLFWCIPTVFKNNSNSTHKKYLMFFQVFAKTFSDFVKRFISKEFSNYEIRILLVLPSSRTVIFAPPISKHFHFCYNIVFLL